MITPSDIENKQFSRTKKGYSPDEVDDFLDLLILDMEKLIRENRQLKEELGKAHVQVDKHMNTETTVYETLEAAKSLMNDIAASAERRAEILLKNAEMEANIITKDAKESISKLTEEGSRLRTKLEMLRGRYKNLLESELERLDFVGNDIIEDFEKDFLPASMTDYNGKSIEEASASSAPEALISADEEEKEEQPASQSASFDEQILKLVNEARAEEGLSPMKLDDSLTSAANKRAEEIVGTFDHKRPDGSDCFTVFDEFSITSYRTAGENIAGGFSTAEDVLNGWMNSSGQRANILNPNFTTLGVGKSGKYWVQLFIG